jgi:hypothetical protein
VTRSVVFRVLEAHGIPEADLDLQRPDDPTDRWWCPSCHYNAFDSEQGLAAHHRQIHDSSVMTGVCGTETWGAVLEELHVDRGCSPTTIGTALPSFAGQHSIRADLERYELRIPGTGGRSVSGTGKSLVEMTVEEFDKHLARLRNGTNADTIEPADE